MFTYANSMSQLSITSKCGMLPLAAALMIVAVAYAGHAAAADWKPEKNVEIVAMSGPGGVLGWTYLNQHAGDGGYISGKAIS